jgi:hypothetical protein
MANRLIDETSPYLLQHANNPVDWFAWGDEAFAKARTDDKPILLSIGYAACHWCHVMERESFEDAATARLMNEWFVPVKVDREERPDVDAIYMDAVQAMTGHGGWPMTMFCTPDGVPFLGGTYFPPEDRHGLPGFTRVLEHVHELWTTRRQDLLAQGNELVRRIAQASSPKASTEPLSSSLLSGAASQMLSTHDPVHGGFGRAPKFPQAPALELALRLHARGFGTARALATTLTRMALGGIYDQIGGGFARYSVDHMWLVPHFEKMLYDNAQLARVYVHGWQAFRDELYRRIANETLDYLLRDMRSPDGGFYSSEDADSEGEEGTFYLWSYDEIMSVAPDAIGYYGVTEEGNFEGRNILTAAGPVPPHDARSRLFAARGRRPRPGLDDKVLASWNGLAIAALAEAGAAFDDARWIGAAETAAEFVLGSMFDGGRLMHSWKTPGPARVPGMLEDYAYLADGLLALWEATFERAWLDACRRMADEAVRLFGDAEHGGFFSTGVDHERLIVRPKEIIESATPSPGAVLALVLQKLAVLYDEPGYAKAAVDAVRTAYAYMERASQAASTWLAALDFYLSTPKEIAIVGERGRDKLLAVVTQRYMPNRVLAGSLSGTDEVALLRDRRPQDGSATAYVCERYVCRSPTTDPHELARQLGA